MANKSFTVTLPEKLVEKLDLLAAKNYRSRSGEVAFAVERYVTGALDGVPDEVIEEGIKEVKAEAEIPKQSEKPTKTNEEFHNQAIKLQDIDLNQVEKF